jgi:hypothetical protein
VVNGDCPRWSDLWPEFARVLDVELGRPLGIDLAHYMANKRGVWRRIVNRHALRATALDELVLWPYGNYVFKPEWDIMSATEKIHAFGFDEAVDTGAMFARQFAHYRAEEIIPTEESYHEDS